MLKLLIILSITLSLKLFGTQAHAQVEDAGQATPAPAPTPQVEPAAAPTVAPLSHAALQGSVQRWHPEIARQRALIAQSRAKLLEAQGSFDTGVGAKGFWNPWYKSYGWLDLGVKQPTPLWGMSVEAGWRIGLGSIPVYKLDYETVSPGGELYAVVNVPLWRDGPIDARRLKIAQSELKAQAADQDMRLAQQSLGIEATEAFFKWVDAGLALKVERQLLELALSRNDGLDERVRRGDLPEIAFVENQRAIYKRRGSVASAEQKFIEAAIKLSLYHRDEEGKPTLPSSGQLPSMESLLEQPLDDAQLTQEIDKALQRRPELRALELKQQQLQAERDWAQNQLAPQVDVQAGVTKSLAPYTFEADSKSELFMGLQVQYYLQRRKAQGQLDYAEASIVETQTKARLLKDKLIAELAGLLAAQRLAYDQADQARQELEAAKRLEAAERDRLALGDSTWLIVNIREQSTAEAARRHIKYLTDYARARAQVLMLLNPPR